MSLEAKPVKKYPLCQYLGSYNAVGKRLMEEIEKLSCQNCLVIMRRGTPANGMGKPTFLFSRECGNRKGGGGGGGRVQKL